MNFAITNNNDKEVGCKEKRISCNIQVSAKTRRFTKKNDNIKMNMKPKDYSLL